MQDLSKFLKDNAIRLKDKTVAVKFGVSIHTVRRARRRLGIYKKGSRGRFQITRYDQEGFISLVVLA